MERFSSPFTTRWRGTLAALAVGLLAVACGGGGGSTPAPGAAPQGMAVGTVTGFGSIIVDGVRYDDSHATVSRDSVAGAPDAGDSAELKLGHHVEVEFDGDDSSSSASHVGISAELIGPVTAISPDLVVAGQTVTVNTDPAAGPVTVFEGYASAAEIQVGDRIEVHGMATADGTVQATRIERRPAAAGWLRVSGHIGDLAADGSSFRLGGLTVTVDSGTRIVPPGSTLANGQRVVVWSRSSTGPDSVVAAIIRVKRPHPDAEHAARLAGPVTDCTVPCAGSFKVGGIGVDASGASFFGGTAADLADGRWVALRGSVDATSGIFKATTLKFRHRDDDDVDVSLRGAVTDFVDMTSFKVRGVPVTTGDKTEIAANCPSPLADGTLVKVRGEVRGLAVLAERIECFNSIDAVTLEAKGRIGTIDADAHTFTLAGPFGGNLTAQWTDTTVFPGGKSATDLAAGQLVRVWGTVDGGVLMLTRIAFCDDLPPPGPGIALFETEGVASGVTKSGDTFTGLTVNGLAIDIVARTSVLERDGPLVDGAKVKVVFFKDGTRNVAALVRTDD